MRKHLKTAVLMGGALLGLGGCASMPWPGSQGYYYPSRSYVPPSYTPQTYDPQGYVDPPAANSWWDGHEWVRDAAVTAGMVGGIEAGKYAWSALRNRAAQAAAARAAAARAAEAQAARAVAGRISAGEVAAGTEADEGDWIIKRVLTVIAEDWWLAL